MSFRLRTDAEKWFSDIERDFAYKFDAYYFCLMAGYAAVRKSSLTSADKPAFVDDFPGDYKVQQNLLLGGLIDCDLRDRGISVTDKAAVQKVVSELLTATGASTHLSLTGAARMNEYASGGFDVLFERMVDKPRKLETFLRGYAKLITELEAERSEAESNLRSS
ncbi:MULTISPECIES: hypothetical protein [Burkholderia]|uniref:hypothetical protein n=1 Tax=Burkholderia TaxID=32008 RepID=UPI000A906353|nr:MULTISPECIES: hypothetical protein [Burkholderia]NOK47381.1 hypothetical protein [Burkholderia thailandensis]OXI77262.1 hypothetical protein CFB44_02085 [Burkholderia sp. AU31280]